MASRKGVDIKIRVKGGEKIYKSAPGEVGVARLQKRLWSLAVAAGRLARKPGLHAARAATLAHEVTSLARRMETLDDTSEFKYDSRP